MKTGVLRNSFVIALGTGISRVFGLARDILLAAVLGAGAQADIFIVAFRLPNLFRRLFAEGAFAAGFIPVYGGLTESERRAFASTVLSLISLFLLALTLLAEIFMEEVVFLLAGGFLTEPDKFTLAVLCARISFPYLIFMFLTALYGALLNVAGRFWATSLVPVLLNIFLIIAALFIGWKNQTELAALILSWGVAAAGVAQILMIGVSAYRAGLLSLPKKITMSPEVKKFLRLIVPALAAGGVVQINIIIGTRIASGQESAVAQLYYAERLYQLPLAMIGIAIGVALLPALSQLVADRPAMRAALARALEGAMLLTLPATAALLMLAQPIIAALFEYGAFNEPLRVEVAAILAAFAVGLPAFVMLRVVSSAFFAHLNTTLPFYFAGVALVVNTALALWWFPLWGAVAIAFATAAAAWVQSLCLWVAAARRGWLGAAGSGARGANALYKKFTRQAIASGLMAAVLYYCQIFYPLPDESALRIVYLAALVFIGLVVYFVLCPAIKLINIKTLIKEFYDK